MIKLHPHQERVAVVGYENYISNLPNVKRGDEKCLK